MSTTITPDDIQLELIKIETQMHRVGGWNMHDRWKSGRLLVCLRDPVSHYLPKGRLQTVAATLKVSRRELGDRMRVADAFRTDAEFKKAAQRCGTWTQLLRSLPPLREARTGSTRPPRDWRRIGHEALGHLLVNASCGPKGRRLLGAAYEYLDSGDES